jgi:CRISPR-associated endonuclease/helicase Cas3
MREIEPNDYVAHTPNAQGEWHSLAAHLESVGRLAGAFGEPLGLGVLARAAGLYHDLGKYTPEFQQYLRDCEAAKVAGRQPPKPGTAPHKQHGAAHTASLASHLALAILGHHGGLPTWAEAAAVIREFQNQDLRRLVDSARADCPALSEAFDFQAQVRGLGSDWLAHEFLIRMLYSCLVDADALDTEAHTNPEGAQSRGGPTPALAEMDARLAAAQATLIAACPATPINEVRRLVYDACVNAAELRPGVFRLTVPTGGGKTRSSLAFALRHAVHHGLGRVIYAIPYTSIVDQTAQVFEDLFGPDGVLEHHSALEPPAEDAPQEAQAQELRRRLAAQNWDAPLIVTTTVQLFESLFGNRPGRSRKVHRLGRSVIVLDEVQTLPPKLLKPLVDGLRTLVEQFGSTVVLCTATQPALGPEVLEAAGLRDAREIAPDPPALFAALQRVQYDLGPLAGAAWDWSRVAAEMRGQCLAVVNSRRDAIALLDALRGGAEADPPDVLHLSTLLCGRHRRETLAEIRRRLATGEPCRVVATQVVECGCDLDFPLVLRALGPLDRIVQAAGRCNREGLRPVDESRVIVFRPADGHAPKGSYRVAMETAERLLRADVDLQDPEVFVRFFSEALALDDTDARNIQKLRRELDFPAVADALRLIEDTRGVLVRHAPIEVEALRDQVRARGGRIGRGLWRRLQPHLVSVPIWEFRRFEQEGLVFEEAPDLWVWLGTYHSVRGLTAAQVDPADLLV